MRGAVQCRGGLSQSSGPCDKTSLSLFRPSSTSFPSCLGLEGALKGWLTLETRCSPAHLTRLQEREAGTPVRAPAPYGGLETFS